MCHFVAAEHSVYSYIRNSNSPVAIQLEKFGAKLITGDLGDVEALRLASQDVDTVFHTEVQTGLRT